MNVLELVHTDVLHIVLSLVLFEHVLFSLDQ